MKNYCILLQNYTFKFSLKIQLAYCTINVIGPMDEVTSIYISIFSEILLYWLRKLAYIACFLAEIYSHCFVKFSEFDLLIKYLLIIYIFFLLITSYTCYSIQFWINDERNKTKMTLLNLFMIYYTAYCNNKDLMTC